MGTAQAIFVVELCGSATESHVPVSHVTRSGVSNVTGSDVSHVPCPVNHSTNINKTSYNISPKEGLNGDGQQFYQYQQNKQ
jgi:hypothetical protein